MSIINKLKEMNFSENEAKIYITLLKYGKSTGYEISKYSGIPRSKIYNHLETMLSRGVIEINSTEKVNLYRAISPDELINLSRKSLNNTLNSFEELVKNIPLINDDEGIWEIEDYNSLILKFEEIISNAKNSLYIQIWSEELNEDLTNSINKKIEEIEKSVVIVYDKNKKYKTNLKKYFAHGFEMERLEDMSNRWISVIADDEIFLYGGILSDKDVSGVYTRNKFLSFFAKEYVKHDAYCLKLIDKFRSELISEYGKDMKETRDIYS